MIPALNLLVNDVLSLSRMKFDVIEGSNPLRYKIKEPITHEIAGFTDVEVFEFQDKNRNIVLSGIIKGNDLTKFSGYVQELHNRYGADDNLVRKFKESEFYEIDRFVWPGRIWTKRTSSPVIIRQDGVIISMIVKNIGMWPEDKILKKTQDKKANKVGNTILILIVITAIIAIVASC